MHQPRGYVVQDWAHTGPAALLGTRPPETVPGTGGGLGSLTAATASLNDAGAKPWHPDSPLFWFGGLLAVTLGLIGASTSIRVGPFRAGVNAGKT